MNRIVAIALIGLLAVIGCGTTGKRAPDEITPERAKETQITHPEPQTDSAYSHILRAYELEYENDGAAIALELRKAYKLDPGSIYIGGYLAETLFTLAQDFWDEKMRVQFLEEGRNVCDEMIRLHPESPVGYEMKAIILSDIPGTTQAEIIDIHENILEISPEKINSVLTLARIFRNAKDYDRAIRVMEKYIGQFPPNRSFLLQLGDLYRIILELDNAIKIFQRYVEEYPEDLKGNLYLAQACLEGLDVECGLECLMKYVRDSGDYDPQILEKIVNLLVSEGRYENAIRWLADLSDATYDEDLKIEIIRRRWRLFRKMGDWQKAERTLYGAIRDAGFSMRGQALLYEDLAVFLAGEERFNEALAAIDAAENLNPDAVFPHLLHARIYEDKGKPEQAEAYYRELADRYENNKEIYGEWARFLARNDRLKDAIPVLEEAIEKFPTDDNFLLSLGSVYFETEDPVRALIYGEKAFELKPFEPENANFVAYILAVTGKDLDRARKLTLEALESEPSNGAYHDTLGWVYYKMGRYDDALTEIMLAVRLLEEEGGEDPEVYSHLGDIQIALEAWDKAREAFRKVLELDGNYPGAGDKLREIEGR